MITYCQLSYFYSHPLNNNYLIAKVLRLFVGNVSYYRSNVSVTPCTLVLTAIHSAVATYCVAVSE